MSIGFHHFSRKSILSWQLRGENPFPAEKGLFPISPVGSVGASACGRGVHRTPAPPFLKPPILCEPLFRIGQIQYSVNLEILKIDFRDCFSRNLFCHGSYMGENPFPKTAVFMWSISLMFLLRFSAKPDKPCCQCDHLTNGKVCR